jgi:hypothetical protein
VRWEGDVAADGGDNEECHIKVDFEADGGGECVDLEEAHDIGERILDEHALGVTGDEVLGGGGIY